MKRNLECPPCGRNWVDAGRHPGEYVRVVRGGLLHHIHCDGCNKPIGPGERACAVSVWTDRVPFREWEAPHLRNVEVLRDDTPEPDPLSMEGEAMMPFEPETVR